MDCSVRFSIDWKTKSTFKQKMFKLDKQKTFNTFLNWFRLKVWEKLQIELYRHGLFSTGGQNFPERVHPGGSKNLLFAEKDNSSICSKLKFI